MRRLILITLFILLMGPTLLLAMNELKWGGPGYDPTLKNSSRFIARPNIYNDENTIEIWVDSQETVKEVGQMRLLSSDGQEISSLQCWKAMKHITAPWACSYYNRDVGQLSGQGKIMVENRSRDILIEDVVNLDNLSSFATKNKKK